MSSLIDAVVSLMGVVSTKIPFFIVTTNRDGKNTVSFNVQRVVEAIIIGAILAIFGWAIALPVALEKIENIENNQLKLERLMQAHMNDGHRDLKLMIQHLEKEHDEIRKNNK